MIKEIFFATTNKHKVEEAKAILGKFKIEVTQIDMEYAENHDASMEIIASNASKKLANKLKKPIVVEDTGFFFNAYKNFPGALSKTIYLAIGYDGFFRLLKDKNREAYAKVVVGYCKPGEEPLTFEGILKGKITEVVYDKDKDIMPYERVFIPQGYKETMSKLTREEKNKISHRKIAFQKLAEYLIKNN